MNIKYKATHIKSKTTQKIEKFNISVSLTALFSIF